MRVMSKYYTRIRMSRMAELLDLTEEVSFMHSFVYLFYVIVLFTSQCYAGAVYAVVTCLCICKARYCIKTAKPRIMQTVPHDSPTTLKSASSIAYTVLAMQAKLISC